MGWYRRFINVLRSDRVSRDIEREMAFHMAERADDLVAAGMSEGEAQREARRRFGNASMQKERARDADVLTWLESLGADLRYAIRALRASPGFAFVTIVSLGLGIGANTAIFSLVNAVVLEALPVSHPEELLQVTLVDSTGRAWTSGAAMLLTNPMWEEIRDRQDVFSGAFAYGGNSQSLTAGGEIRRAAGLAVSGEFFTTLGVRPAVGRLLTRADDVRGCPAVAVLGHDFWQSEYGGSRDVVGRTIVLDGTPHVVIGVSERRFFGVEVGRSVQVYTPLCLRPGLDARSTWFLIVMGRPKAGLTTAGVNARLAALAPAVFGATIPERWGAAEKRAYLTNGLGVRPAANGTSELRRAYEKALTVLMVVVAVVLLIACANVANLLLARATVRGREMAIRLAIGAGRRRLVRQLLTESVLLAGVGGLAGILFARWGSVFLVRVLSGGPSSVWLDLSLDRRVLAFTLVVAVTTGVLFGLAPAWRASRVDPQTALKAGARGIAEAHTRSGIGKGLVIAQIALSLVLLVGAGLLLGSFRKLTTLDPGFRREGVLVVSANLRPAGYRDAAYATVQRDLLDRFRRLPGVEAASASSLTPISGSSWNDYIVVQGFTPRDEEDAIVFFNAVSDGYFATMGTPLLAGRDFDAGDQPGTPAVAIVNETLARKFFGVTHAIGKSYRVKQHDSLGEPVVVVGVVKDAKYRTMREETLPTIYVSLAQDTMPGPWASYELRAVGPPAALIPAVKSAVAEVNRSIPLELTTLSRQVEASLTRERLLATLSVFFGALALLLATVGLYGTLSYSMARRRNEIGIRIALGAEQGRVMRLVLGEVARMVTIGIVIGGAASLGATRWLTAFLFGLSASDPATLAIAALTLAFVALVAGAIPALRASRLDPIAALREE